MQVKELIQPFSEWVYLQAAKKSDFLFFFPPFPASLETQMDSLIDQMVT